MDSFQAKTSQDSARVHPLGRTRPHRPKYRIIFVSLSVAIGMAALVWFSPVLFLDRFSVTAPEVSAERMATGTVAESDTKSCRRLTFDGDGRVFQDVVPCDDVTVLNARGQPVPIGTMHRLDAISKSFSGH